MIELDMIEPLDVDTFPLSIAAFDLYAASRAGKTHTLPFSDWQVKHKSLFDMVRIKAK